jgi:TonB-like protein
MPTHGAMGRCRALVVATGLAVGTGASVSAQEPACSGVSAAPVPVRVVAPRYPEDALRARVQGFVTVALDVAPSGSVATVTPCRTIPLLADACTRAAKQWMFAAVEASAARRTIVTCRFILDDAEVEPLVYLAPAELQVHGQLVTLPAIE